jgi:hypothetical protein
LQPSHLIGNVVRRRTNITTDKNTAKFLSGQPIIAQVMSLIPEHLFQKVVAETSSDKYYKQMKSKDHFLSFFYAVLTRNSSLRGL